MIYCDMQVAADFWEVISKLNDVEGFLHPLEGYMLMKLAESGNGIGSIVEIGSYCGRSTAFLATGSKRAGREMVYAIDHFKGSPENQKGEKFQSEALVKDGSTLPTFIRNMERLELIGNVMAMVQSSVDAYHEWRFRGYVSIRLLFIDGDHSYESVKQDFELWSPFVCDRGFICFHDYSVTGEVWEGVTRFVDELLDGKLYLDVATVMTLKIIQRVQ